LPVIVTSAQPYHPVITHYANGIIIEPNNTQALVTALEIVIKNKSVRKKLGTAGLHTVQTQFTSTAMVNAYKNIFREISR
jgi:glycosyltransferase involved in cell wall biosynthesis